MSDNHSTIHSAVIIPAAQSAISGLLTGSLAGSAALVFDWGEPAAWAVLSTAGVSLASWLIYRGQWREVANFVQGLRQPTMEPQELTTRIQVISSDPASAFAAGVWAELPLPVETVRQAARRILETGAFSHSLAGPGKPLSRSQYEALRDELLARGLLVWQNPAAHSRGLEITAAGRAVLRRLSDG
jgi:hypothetical protein